MRSSAAWSAGVSTTHSRRASRAGSRQVLQTALSDRDFRRQAYANVRIGGQSPFRRRFAKSAKQLVSRGQELAAAQGSPEVLPPHVLLAMLEVRPVPFCVLDEVDAALDEANVGRFNQAVREMTDRSQFIIITHNRRTMEIADRLCGITMEEPGVSKLVAVNLKGGQGKAGRAKVQTEAPAAPLPA